MNYITFFNYTASRHSRSRDLKWLSETGVMRCSSPSPWLCPRPIDRTDPMQVPIELAHSDVSGIKKACHEFCPHVEVMEIISCAPEASSDHSDDTKVELSLLKKVLLQGNKSVVDVSCQKHVVMEEWLHEDRAVSAMRSISGGVRSDVRSDQWGCEV